MDILFLSLSNIQSIEDRGINSDLLRKFKTEGHHITLVTPAERRDGVATNIREQDGVSYLKVRTLNIMKTNVAEKYGYPVIVSTHPRTRNMINEKKVEFHPLVQLMKPMGLSDYNSLQVNSFAVLSDSGTISEE